MSERFVGGENMLFKQKGEAYYRFLTEVALDFKMPSGMLKQLEKRDLLSEEEIHGYICSRIEELDNPTVQNIKTDFVPVFKAQLRAVDYLYGTGDLVDSEDANPLVDILALIANPKFKGESSEFQLTTEKEPLPKPLFAKAEPANKGEQRTFDEYSFNGQEYRTITSFGEIMPTTIRGLYIMAEASKAHPSILKSALDQYEALIPNNGEGTEGMAVGLLEILHNAHLLYDRRFYNFATQLRDVVLDEVGDYRNLKTKYAYTIVTVKPFWYRGEKERTRDHDKFKYIPALNPIAERVSEASYSIPQFDNWPIIAKKRVELTRLIRQLTVNNSIKKSTPNFSPEKALNSIKQDRLNKATLSEERRNLELKQPDNLKKVWRSFVEDEIDENVITEAEEVKFAEKILSKIVTLFTEDKSMSQKAKTNFQNIVGGSASGFYGLKTETLLKDPMFHWILAMRIPETRRSFREAVAKSPESTTSFYLFLRLLTYETARVSFHTKELDFLFDPTFAQKMSPDKVLAFLDSVLYGIQDHVPDVRRLTKAILPESRKAVSDLLKPELLNRIKDNLDFLKYREFFGLKTRIPKAIGFAEEDREFMKKSGKAIAKTTAYLAGMALVGLGTAYGIDKIKIAPQTPDKPQAPTSESNPALEKFIQSLDKLFGSDKTTDTGAKQSESGAGQAPTDGKFPESIADRIPDAILPESLKNIGPAVYGEILHFPEGLKMDANGSPVGYFPWTALMMVNWQRPDFGSWFAKELPDGVPSQQLFTRVGDVTEQNPDYQPGDLAYLIDSPNNVIYPPIGWKIRKIYQEGGSDPRQGNVGALYYDQKPDRVLVVLEKLNEIYLGDTGRIKYFDEFQTSGYDAKNSFNMELPTEVNRNLSGDPVLQHLHADYINDLVASFEQGPEAESAVIIRYAELYAQYTNTYRYYALNFQVDKNTIDAPAAASDIDSNYATLESIAANPDKGYFCSVAAYAFRDFIASGSVATAVQPGITLYNYQDHLIGKLAHENNILLLPNGKILEVDMTPYVTDKTPQADIDALNGRPITEEEIKKLISQVKPYPKHVNYEKIGEAIGLTSAGLPLGLLLTMVGSEVYSETKRKAISKRINRSLAMNRNLTGLEKDLVLAASSRLSLLSYDDTFPDTASQLLTNIEAYDRKKYDYAINWLSNDGEMLLEEDNAEAAFKRLCMDVKDASPERVDEIRRNLPWEVFQDISRYNGGAETIECPYDFSVIYNLSKTLYEKDYLKLARDVYQRLGVAISGTSDLALRYKVTDVLDLLKRRYASKQTPDSVKPLFNGMYNLINNELSDVENKISAVL